MAQPNPPNISLPATSFHRIGAGACGSVWTPALKKHPNFGCAFKRGDGDSKRSLTNDAEMHRLIFSSFIFKRFIDPDDSWWDKSTGCFPSDHLPCNVIMAELIPTHSEKTKHLLIDRYFPSEGGSDARDRYLDQHCLIRPYLGRYRSESNARSSRFHSFKLQNFILRLDQMEDLGLPQDDLTTYAEIMGETLAILHW